MYRASQSRAENSRITLGLLNAVEHERASSQRALAVELGVALGLVNAYIKRCVKKGLVKVHEAPARRYAYYLTPRGFAEKSRLTAEYLSYSFEFFRKAKADCSELLAVAKAAGVARIVLLGRSDLAEIAALCALEEKIEIVGVVQSGATSTNFVGQRLFPDFDAISESFDAVMITDLRDTRESCKVASSRFGSDRVLIPQLLGVRIGSKGKRS